MKVSQLYKGLLLGFILGIAGGALLSKAEVFAKDLVPANAVLITYTVVPHSLNGVHQAIDHCNQMSGFVSTIKNEVVADQVVSKVSCLFIKNEVFPTKLLNV